MRGLEPNFRDIASQLQKLSFSGADASRKLALVAHPYRQPEPKQSPTAPRTISGHSSNHCLRGAKGCASIALEICCSTLCAMTEATSASQSST
jgi:hypothetical protein